jgi:CSLREA domain-containing protein
MRDTVAAETVRTRRANEALALGVVAVVVALFFDLLLTAKPAYAKTFTVNSTGDANGKCDPFGLFTNCSLREAINAANSNDNAPTVDTIAFNIPGSGLKPLTPDSELPPMTEPVTIDGYTQRPCASNPAPCSRPNTDPLGAVDPYLLIELDGSDAGSSAYGLSVVASNTMIKGLIVINFGDDGIESSESAKGLKVRGNLLGTDNSGSLGQGNTDGVDIDGNNTIVGGTTPAARNLIFGNSDDGISTSSSGSKVEGNLISFNQGDGVSIGGGNNTVGGPVSAAANIILENGSDGVRVANNAVTGNRFLRNHIESNGQLGIDLSGGTEDPPPTVGITLNDFKDTDGGPNGLQNYPQLFEAQFSLPHTTTITGKLNSRPEKKYTVQFFASETGDPDGFGEGEIFLGQKQVETNNNGNASFTFTTTLPELNNAISATATGGGGTSEFAHWIDVSL